MADIKKRFTEDREQDSATQTNPPDSEAKPKKRNINWDKVTANGDRQESLAHEPELTTIPIRPPKPDEFFRCMPGQAYTRNLNIIIRKDDNEWYMIEEDILESLGHESTAKKMSCHVGLTMANTLFVTLVPLPDEEGKRNPWHKSSLHTMELAKDEWIRRQAEKSTLRLPIS